MIYRVRTINLQAEHASARDATVRAAAYATEHFPDIQVEILENIAGPGHQIHMVTRCVSLAVLEAYEAQRKLERADVGSVFDGDADKRGVADVGRL